MYFSYFELPNQKLKSSIISIVELPTTEIIEPKDTHLI